MITAYVIRYVVCNPEHRLLKTKEIYTNQRDPPNVIALAYLGSVANLGTVYCVPFREGGGSGGV
jgi:hypothetical protein